jgi:3-oxoacyl-[acyl-carrier protein] reductase
MRRTDMPKTAVVTGSSRGIGRAVALKLGSQGFSIVVNYAGNMAEAEKVVGEIKATGAEAIAVQADISKSEEVSRLFDEAERAFGGIDVLVNNAGIMALKPVAETDDEIFDRIFAVNVRGTFNTIRDAARRLRPGGRIVNFSSTVVALGLPTYAVYVASKGAVEALTKTLANEFRGKNITVNTVSPGPTGTELFFQGKSEEQIQHFAKMAPLERLGTPEDIANAVAFLVGPEGGWVNGQTLRVNGGIA